MFGRISNAGIAVGVVLIVIGGIVLWIWLGDSDLGESPVDEAAQMQELDESEDDAALAEEPEAGEEGAY